MFRAILLLSLLLVGCGQGLHFRNTTVLGTTHDPDTRSTRVSVSFEVWDGQTQLTRLSRESFTVYEDGQPATSESINEAESTERRVPVVLLLDTSLSMYQAGAMDDLKAAAQRFEQILGQNGFEVTVYRFASRIERLASIEAVPEQFAEDGGERWTSLYAAVGRGLAAQDDAIVVAFSDGADNYSQNHGVTSLRAVEEQVLPEQLGGTGEQRVIHTIGFGNVTREQDRQGVPGGQALERLARNGSFRFAQQPGALDSVFQDLADRIRNVYVFDYFSPNLDGKHTLQLEARVGNRIARSPTLTFVAGGGSASTGPSAGTPGAMGVHGRQLQLMERAGQLGERCARGERCEEWFDAVEEMMRALPEGTDDQFAAAQQTKGAALMRVGCSPERPTICKATAGVPEQVLPTAAPIPPDKPSIGVVLQALGNLGVVVVNRAPNSPAVRAGLLTGDLIRSVDGEEVTTMQEVVDAIRSKPAGTPLKLGIRREGEPLEITVEAEQAEGGAEDDVSGDEAEPEIDDAEGGSGDEAEPEADDSGSGPSAPSAP